MLHIEIQTAVIRNNTESVENKPIRPALLLEIFRGYEI